MCSAFFVMVSLKGDISLNMMNVGSFRRVYDLLYEALVCIRSFRESHSSQLMFDLGNLNFSLALLKQTGSLGTNVNMGWELILA